MTEGYRRTRKFSLSCPVLFLRPLSSSGFHNPPPLPPSDESLLSYHPHSEFHTRVHWDPSTQTHTHKCPTPPRYGGSGGTRPDVVPRFRDPQGPETEDTPGSGPLRHLDLSAPTP